MKSLLIWLSANFFLNFPLQASFSCRDHFMADRGPRNFMSPIVVVRAIDILTGKKYSFFRGPSRSGYGEVFALKRPWHSLPPSWDQRFELVPTNFRSFRIFELETGEFVVFDPSTIDSNRTNVTNLNRIQPTDLLYRYGLDLPAANSHRDLIKNYLDKIKFTSSPKLTRFIVEYQDAIIQLIVNHELSIFDLNIQSAQLVRDAKTGRIHGYIQRNGFVESILIVPKWGGFQGIHLKEMRRKFALIFENGQILRLSSWRKIYNEEVPDFDRPPPEVLSQDPDYRFFQF